MEPSPGEKSKLEIWGHLHTGSIWSHEISDNQESEDRMDQLCGYHLGAG